MVKRRFYICGVVTARVRVHAKAGYGLPRSDIVRVMTIVRFRKCVSAQPVVR